MAGRIFVLLPIYNEEPALRQLVQDIKSVMDKMGRDWLIIACNDGSKDNSGQILKELSQKYPMDIITHNMNRGLWETIRDLFE
ncbi:MAG: glycosyltransferase, partial [Candidatus Calescibacterium sp.]|nr:glycosyltransferase [Candidatus Calescibacterium sp.]